MKITCLMITGGEQGFNNMPDIAVECFLAQTHPDCDLLIINHGKKSFSGKNITEIKVEKTDKMHVGDLRNMAFDHASGDYIACFDSDDWHHPDRLKISDPHLQPDSMFMLRDRVVLNLKTGKSGTKRILWGSNNTMIYPKNTTFRFPSIKNGSDSVFANNFRKLKLIDNDPGLYVRTWHGGNLTEQQVVMDGLNPLPKSLEKQISTIRGLYK